MTDTSHEIDTQVEASALPFGSNERDWVLAHVVRLTNVFGIGFELVLYTPTGVIAGKTISGQEYFDRIAKSFGDPSSKKAKDRLAGLFDSMGQQYKPDKEDGTYSEDNPIQTKIPQYIHLDNCKIFYPGHSPFPDNDGILWRGNLDKVVGFTFGSVSIEKKDA
ncbi:MAG TPA: hypothetical protein VFU20_03375 [Sphingomicrobium sp.]|nr:hypothetical protein [Sphingomicrobium sp.]